ncbi:MAG: DUF951 domain-containing protein [Firmicutes bacterium]|nr:DUF951 domain-containing protein [Bacillota bacterium]
MEGPKFAVGSLVRMKKAHPCGSNRWEIIRVGADFKIKCLGCGRRVMLPRTKFEKSVKEIIADG